MSDCGKSKNYFVRLLRSGNFLVVLAILLSCIVCLAKQSGQSTQTDRSSPDSFLGAWRFNPDKSSGAGLESKSIAIESQGTRYKLIIDCVQQNGVKWYFSATTNMNAEVVSTFDKTGKQTSQQWRVTRDGPSSFRLDWLGPYGMQQRYEVTADGKTMTMHDVTASPKIIGGTYKGGRPVPVDHTEVFDRVLTNPVK